MKKIKGRSALSEKKCSRVLTVNPGSTSTKYKLFDLKGNVLGEKVFTLKEEKKEFKFLSNITDLEKIAIRVVHGGEITKTSKITQAIKNEIIKYTVFAPIHNAGVLEIIEKMEKVFPKKNLYACFDTAFHTTIPVENSTYPIPLKISKKYNLKKYGFHGLAISSALNKLNILIKKEDKKIPKKIILAHLGGGCSITAVKNGKSFMTSMGLTPLSGIPMITRSGDIDPDIFSVLCKKDLSVEQVSEILNKHSGFLGLTGSKDIKNIIKKALSGSKKEKLAFDIFISEIIQKIFAYAGNMQGIDTVVFSGGIGYGNKYLRDAVTKKLKILGLSKKDIYSIDIDEEFVMFNELQNLS